MLSRRVFVVVPYQFGIILRTVQTTNVGGRESVCVCVWKVGAALAWGWLGRCVAWVAGGRERVGRVGGGGGWWDEVISRAVCSCELLTYGWYVHVIHIKPGKSLCTS